MLSGWDTKEKSSDVIGEVSTQSDTTQIKPTFSRQDLGAELSNVITYNSKNFNSANEIIKGSYNPQQNIIEFFKGADASTSTHEIANV